MKVCVIGLGSMGQRRIRLLKEIDREIVIVGIDKNEERVRKTIAESGINCYSDLAEVSDDMECAFVCTSPQYHASIIEECLKRNLHVFSEINLVSDRYEENSHLAKQKNRVLFLSSTPLYKREMQILSERVKQNGRPCAYQYHTGQYLPDWHPWEDYTEFFIGDRRTNGCREIMAIELPWLTRTFGRIMKTHVLADKMTDLRIDYRDNYIIQAEHENGSKGALIIDVVSPVAVRKLEVYGEHRYIQWGGTPDSLYEYNAEADRLEQVVLQEAEEHREGYRAFVIENAYKNEIREFMAAVMNERQPEYGFSQDLEILKLIDALEEEE